MLEDEKILANTKKYFETAKKGGFMTDDLIKFLGEDFINAPASEMISYYNAFKGGLIEHSLRVAKYAVSFNNSLPEDEKVDQNSLLKVCLLSQIGKVRLFTPNTSEWHIKNQGKVYEYAKTLTSMRISERSLYYAMMYGIHFTEEEYSAILMSDKIDDKQAEYHNTLLGELLKMGNLFAIKHEKNKYGK